MPTASNTAEGTTFSAAISMNAGTHYALNWMNATGLGKFHLFDDIDGILMQSYGVSWWTLLRAAELATPGYVPGVASIAGAPGLDFEIGENTNSM